MSTPNPEPRWLVPAPYGYASAIEGMGFVSAPLLAGFSVTLAVLVIQAQDSFRWPGVALFLFVAAALAFIAAVQFTFRARQYAVTPPEIEMWWKDPNEPGRREMLRREQRYYQARHEAWAKPGRTAYDTGILAFLLAVTIILVPHGGLDDASAGRLATIALAAVGLVGEGAWIVRTRSPIRGQVADWPPPPGPEMVS